MTTAGLRPGAGPQTPRGRHRPPATASCRQRGSPTECHWRRCHRNPALGRTGDTQGTHDNMSYSTTCGHCKSNCRQCVGAGCTWGGDQAPAHTQTPTADPPLAIPQATPASLTHQHVHHAAWCRGCRRGQGHRQHDRGRQGQPSRGPVRHTHLARCQHKHNIRGAVLVEVRNSSAHKPCAGQRKPHQHTPHQCGKHNRAQRFAPQMREAIGRQQGSEDSEVPHKQQETSRGNPALNGSTAHWCPRATTHDTHIPLCNAPPDATSEGRCRAAGLQSPAPPACGGVGVALTHMTGPRDRVCDTMVSAPSAPLPSSEPA